ncbi:actin-binding Rho-activating protein-like [Huso huso]|uniref:Actin-binding Rho-activating protein-like n=1 Tax=Huso huso TaxID=61971 RepID=A0ABR1A195_HUSHU
MSESDRKSNLKKSATANKNIKKLRIISTVCSLTKSWQQWASENEDKHASEPSGWAPHAEKEEKPKQYKKRSADQTTGSIQKTQSTEKLEGDSGKAPLESKIRSKQVTKTITSKVQEKGSDISFLTNRYKNDTNEADKILYGNMSPTRRRKCSNLVSELTQGWKDMEKENHKTPSNSMDTEDSGSLERDEKKQEEMEKSEKQEVTEEYSPVRIKRPSTTLVNKDVDEAKKINLLAKKHGPVGNLKSRWQNWAEQHTVTQKLNPFSENFDYSMSMATRLHKGDEGYGRPKEGTKTAERAKRAEAHIHREISDMCFIIRTMENPGPDGKTRVNFGQLFDRYVRISDKVVGILMRARKHGKLHFEGEMLWQGRDDHVVITLLV